MNTWFWVFVAGLAAASVFSIALRSLRDFSRSQFETICRKRGMRHVFGEVIRQREHVDIIVTSLQLTSVAVSTGAAIAWFSERFDSGTGGPIWFAGGVIGILLLWAATLWIPQTIATLWAAPILFFTWPLWRALGIVLAGPHYMGHFLTALGHRLAGRTPVVPDEETLEDEIRSIVAEGQQVGIFEQEAMEMIEGVIELGDADVADIMTPRTDMLCVGVDTEWDEMVRFVIDCAHTRIPVFGKNRDDIIGILYSKDLLPELAKPSGESRRKLSEIMRKPHFVPETKPLDDLLELFQKARNHMAVVLDEYGGVSGLVTIEDVLEEIVGEIVDEFDEEEEHGIHRLDDTTSEVLGRVRVDEVNEQLGLRLPEDGEYDTIAGFVFSELGHVPVAGEELVWRGVRLSVVEASERIIEKLRVENLDETEAESPPAPAE